jgi:hypothetical protein
MVRATLLYDTVAARLYREINVFKEFQKYSDDVAKRARRRIEESAIRQLLLGPDDRNFLKAQQIVDVGNGILFRVQKFLDDPAWNFAEVAGKIYSAIRAFVRMFIISVCVGIVAFMTGILLYQIHENTGWLKQKLQGNYLLLDPNKWPMPHSFVYPDVQLVAFIWLLIVTGLVLAYGRRIYLRFGDIDD